MGRAHWLAQFANIIKAGIKTSKQALKHPKKANISAPAVSQLDGSKLKQWLHHVLAAALATSESSLLQIRFLKMRRLSRQL